jgi:hypothetical protein
LHFFLPLGRTAEQQALPARAGFGGQNHQTPNPPLGPESPKVWANARTCPVHAVLAAPLIFPETFYDFMPDFFMFR